MTFIGDLMYRIEVRYVRRRPASTWALRLLIGYMWACHPILMVAFGKRKLLALLADRRRRFAKRC